MVNWKDKTDPLIKEHLKAQIRKSYEQEDAFDRASNKANAQLWIAIANLSKEIFDLNLRIRYLEKKLPKKNINKKGKTKNLKKY